MEYNKLLTLVDAFLEEKLFECKQEIENNIIVQQKRGPRGKPGKDFLFSDHEKDILNILSQELDRRRHELSLKFMDLSEDEKDQLKLKFDHLNPEDIAMLRGPRGQRGKSGQDFIFEENKIEIENIITSFINENQSHFKIKFSDFSAEEIKLLTLKFSDLSEDEKESLKGERGPRGQRGAKGVQGEAGAKGEAGEKGEKGDRGDIGPRGAKGSIGPQGDRGVQGETGEKGERGERGPRGQRGAKGVQGETGAKGEIGPVGPMGPMGLPGLSGLDGKQGRDGKDGKDAPTIIDIEVNEFKRDEFSFVFKFSDGSEIETDSISIPSTVNMLSSFMGSSGGGGGLSSITIYKDNVLVGESTALNFEGDNINTTFDPLTQTTTISVDETNLDDACVSIADEGNEITDCVKAIDFIGEGVEVISGTFMSDWALLSDVTTMSGYESANPGQVKVSIPGRSSKLGLIRTAVENINQYDMVRLVSSTEVAKGSSNSSNSAKISGIALNSALIGEDVEFILFGIVEDPSFNFPLLAKLFLQSDGTLGTTAPANTGDFIVVSGESLGTGAIFVKIQEPEGIV